MQVVTTAAAEIADGITRGSELRNLGEVSAWAALLALGLWLLWYLPRWRKENVAREEANAQRHAASLHAANDQCRALIDSAHERHTNLLQHMADQSEKDRQACAQYSRDTIAAVRDEVRELRSDLNRGPR